MREDLTRAPREQGGDDARKLSGDDAQELAGDSRSRCTIEAG